MHEDSGDSSLPVAAAVMARSERTEPVERLLASALHEVSHRAHLGTAPAATPRLGVDVADITVLARQLRSRIGPEFKLRIFTGTEIADCRDQAAKFATRWAVKEAVSKAIGTGFRQGLHPSDIETVTAPDGSIRVTPASGRTWPHGAEDWTWMVSAAHEAGVAVAVVIALPSSQVHRMSERRDHHEPE
jgi:holo-[acyl-carrier protein] synthase